MIGRNAKCRVQSAERSAPCVALLPAASEWLALMVMLKSFQRLGYFVDPESVPTAIIAHVRKCLNFSGKVAAIPSVRSRRYYQQAIRVYLNVLPYDRTASQLAATVIARAAVVMEHPADLLNVAIEELVKERYELPAFSTLDRLV